MQRIEHKIIDDVEHKWCGRCKRWLPLGCFGKNRVKWDGLQERCSECKAEHHKNTHISKPRVPKTEKSKKRIGLLEDGDGWVTIAEFPNYQITADGRVRSRKNGKEKAKCINKRGYWAMSMRKNGKMYLRTLHRMLAVAFIPNPENKPDINHIDGNKRNCSLDNLEWVTCKENNIHARNTGLHESDGDKPIGQFKDGVLVRTFKSASDASRILGISRANICNCARGNTRLKTYKSYEWKYIEK